MTANEYTGYVHDALDDLTSQQTLIEEAAHVIADTWPGRGRVYTMGNGAGVALAEHFAADLLKWCRVEMKGGVAAFPLTAGPLLTALANDEGYNRVFVAQLASYRDSRKDVMVAFSCSGQSKNVVEAMKSMRGIYRTIAITGNPQAPLLDYADVGIVCRGIDYRVQEDMFSIVAHAIVGLVREHMLEALGFSSVDQ